MRRKVICAIAAYLATWTLTLFPSAVEPIIFVPSESISYTAPVPTYAAENGTETSEPYPASDFYYSQLTDEGKLIYDAVTDQSNRQRLIEGEPITVGTPFSITIPQNPTQNEYNALVEAFSAEQQRLQDIAQYHADAAAAINRDRSDLFWMNGFQTSTVCTVDGERVSGSFSFALGKTYTLALVVTLPLGADWDGLDATDRDLFEDIDTLTAAVTRLSIKAIESGTRYYEQLRYINEQLCKYNDYNTTAAEGGYPLRYPWTALSALDQLTAENDANGGLKPVCEGYARALKLICDELGIPCVLVGGTGNGENHLWNYVRLENGYWYAIDVTWNDGTRSEDYFLVGKDVMDKSHVPSGNVMSSGQTISFVYPELSQDTYRPTNFSLSAKLGDDEINSAIIGGGTVTVVPNGVTDQNNLTLSCDDPDIVLTVNADGTRTATFPNKTATYRFTGTYRDADGDYNAELIVSVEHAHQYGAAQPHDEAQHKKVCDCNEARYEDHAFGLWTETKPATEEESGKKERACSCGFVDEETIPKLEKQPSESEPSDEDDKTDESDPSDKNDKADTDTKKPNASKDDETVEKNDKPNGSNGNAASGDPFGCSVSIVGSGTLLVCAIASLALLRKRENW